MLGTDVDGRTTRSSPVRKHLPRNRVDCRNADSASYSPGPGLVMPFHSVNSVERGTIDAIFTPCDDGITNDVIVASAESGSWSLSPAPSTSTISTQVEPSLQRSWSLR